MEDPEQAPRSFEEPVDVESLWVRYSLPLTLFSVDAAIEVGLSSQPGKSEGQPTATRVVKNAKVVVATSVTTDPLTGYQLILTEQSLAKKSVSLTLDKNRIITAMNTSTSRDFTPILKGISTLLPSFAGVIKLQDNPPLEELWDCAFRELAEVRIKLIQKLSELLNQLSDSSPPADIVLLGDAINVVKSELSAIDGVRRDWIAGHAEINSKKQFTLRASELPTLRHIDLTPRGEFPSTLPSDVEVPQALKEIVSTYRTLIVLHDPERGELSSDPDGNIPPPPRDTTDHIIVRRPRLARFALYARADNITENAEWVLDPTSVQQITLVDDLSTLYSLLLSAKFFQSRQLEMAFDADHSIKTYAITRESTLGGLVTSAADLVSAGKDLFKSEPEKTADEKAIAEAKAKIELLKNSGELSRLANRYGLRDEVDLADRLVRIADK